MRIFLTGASGFIGSRILSELLAAGHQVTGLARSEASALALQTAGAEVQYVTLKIRTRCWRRSPAAMR